MASYAYKGKRIEGDRYEIQHRIGAGSFKSVWRAEDRLKQIPVALSILHESQNIDHVRERFWQEAHILHRLTLDVPSEVAPYTQRVVEE